MPPHLDVGPDSPRLTARPDARPSGPDLRAREMRRQPLAAQSCARPRPPAGPLRGGASRLSDRRSRARALRNRNLNWGIVTLATISQVLVRAPAKCAAHLPTRYCKTCGPSPTPRNDHLPTVQPLPTPWNDHLPTVRPLPRPWNDHLPTVRPLARPWNDRLPTVRPLRDPGTTTAKRADHFRRRPASAPPASLANSNRP